jgi:hypothetical protein
MAFLEGLFGGKSKAPPAAAFVETAPNEIVVEGAPPFPIAKSLVRDGGFPLLDWDAVYAWWANVDETRRNDAWKACERGWLMHLKEALGPSYKLVESPHAIVVSTLEAEVAQATLAYIESTVGRILRVLDGVARGPEPGRDILLVFDDEDTYYRYVSIYHGDGAYATSGGMYLWKGYGHFVTTKADLRQMEPFIVRELTHTCLYHLDLPRWLHEGLAVNTEAALGHKREWHVPVVNMQEMQKVHDKHLAFWSDTRMQAFWCGEAFHTPGDDNKLAYDLARVMVEMMSKDWDAFKAFANDAKMEDAGAAAARLHLGVDLGEYACALIEKEHSPAWSPDPSRWNINAGESSP